MSFSGDPDAAKRSERWLGKDSFRVINIRCEDSVEILKISSSFSPAFGLLDHGFEKELASADINDRFVVARFGVENHWVALKAIQQFAGIRQVRII